MSMTRTDLKAKEWSLYSFISAKHHNFASKIYLWLAIMINFILYSLSAQPTSFSRTWLFPLVYVAPVLHTPGNYKEDPLGSAPRCLLGVFNPRPHGFHESLETTRRTLLSYLARYFSSQKASGFPINFSWFYSSLNRFCETQSINFFKFLQTCLTLTTLLALPQIAKLR